MSKRHHPVFRRFGWHPVVAAVPLAWFIYRVATSAVTPFRVIALCVAAIWFALSTFDLATHHRYLDWLYSEDDEGGGAAAG